MKKRLSHVDARGRVRAWWTSRQVPTVREAVARGHVSTHRSTSSAGPGAQGNVIAAARLAAVMAAKRTNEAHPARPPGAARRGGRRSTSTRPPRRCAGIEVRMRPPAPVSRWAARGRRRGAHAPTTCSGRGPRHGDRRDRAVGEGAAGAATRVEAPRPVNRAEVQRAPGGSPRSAPPLPHSRRRAAGEPRWPRELSYAEA